MPEITIADKHHMPELGLSDHDIFEVNFADKIQVQIDRTEDDKIQIRVWQIGDDSTLETFDCYLPVATDCMSCNGRVGTEFLVDRLCSTCRKPYDAEELIGMRAFARGIISGWHSSGVVNRGDEWFAFADDLDVKVGPSEDTVNAPEAHYEARGYRRGKHSLGSCEDEVRLV